MGECTLCPRKCLADRDKTTGYCAMTSEITVARAALHFWEEPCISGKSGSGTVFFSGCSLKCVYCQNREISFENYGTKMTYEKLGEIFLKLASEGACNINLVTPTHFVPQIISAIDYAKARGLNLPIVYNTSGYELCETIKMLEGRIDVYLPDFKYANSGTAEKYSNAPDYPSVAAKALAEMVRQQPKPVFNGAGIMTNGVIVRNLLLPGSLKNSKNVLDYVYRTYGGNVYISIMNQYTPVRNFEKHPELNSRVTNREYEKLVNYAIDLGIKNAFIQEGKTASESFIPRFDGTGTAT